MGKPEAARRTRMRRRTPRPLPRRDEVFGRTAPGVGFLHRTPAGLKLLGLAALTLVVLLVRQPLLSLAVIGGLLVLRAAARVPAGMLLSLLRRIWILLAAVLAAQLIFNDPVTAAEVLSRILACLLAAQLMILTTPPMALLEVFRTLLRPLRPLGAKPGRAALAALVMLRSIPYLADLSALAGRQARARGLERDLRARTVPLLLGAVAYAQDTGRALAARGIDDLD